MMTQVLRSIPKLFHPAQWFKEIGQTFAQSPRGDVLVGRVFSASPERGTTGRLDRSGYLKRFGVPQCRYSAPPFGGHSARRLACHATPSRAHVGVL